MSIWKCWVSKWNLSTKKAQNLDDFGQFSEPLKKERTPILDLLLQIKKETFDDVHAKVFIGEVYWRFQLNSKHLKLNMNWEIKKR